MSKKTELKLMEQVGAINELASKKDLPIQLRRYLRDAASAIAEIVALEIAFESCDEGYDRALALSVWMNGTIRRLQNVHCIHMRKDGFTVAMLDGKYIHCRIEESEHE